MNFLSKIFNILLLLPCILYSMEQKPDFSKLLCKIKFSDVTFACMLEQEMKAIEPYAPEDNGYIRLLKKVNEQLLQQGKVIDSGNNEFTKEALNDEEIQESFRNAVDEPKKMEIFRHKWRKKIREQLSRKTPIQYIKRQDNESAESVIKKRLEANKDIDPNNRTVQENFCKAKQAIYSDMAIEKAINHLRDILSLRKQGLYEKE